MSGGVARGRLAEERKSWRKNHPHGFVAKPEPQPDGSVNLLYWKCYVPGKAGVSVLLYIFYGYLIKPCLFSILLLTDWEGGHYPVTLKFNEDYPTRPPICKFPQGFLHPNVYPSGMVCLSILSEEEGWKPAFTVKQILVGIQDLLDNPNPDSPANHEMNDLFEKDLDEYKRRMQLQAKQYLRVI